MSSVRTVGSVICAGVASSLVVAVLYAVLVWLRLPAQPWLGLRSFVSFALPLVLLQSVAAGCSWVRRSRASGWGERDDPLDAACAAGWCGIVLAATCLPATQVHLATVESLGVRGGWAVAFLALPVTLTRRAALLPAGDPARRGAVAPGGGHGRGGRHGAWALL
ncbi:MAG: hypothetical protein R3F62_18265 [Planctomycetota bacterium]